VSGQTCDACTVPSVPPASTGTGGIVTDANGLRGTFLYVERSRLSDVQMALRVRDLSRASQTWGTNVPIVSEDRFRSGPFSIIDIPNDADFRSTLRIYSLDSFDATPVLLRLYGRTDAPAASPFAFTTDTLLGEATVTLAVESIPTNTPYPTRPAFRELSDLSVIGNPKGHHQLRLEVTSLREGKRLWAFVSVTNNSTQHVTVLEPLIP
jgi:hypothetical protein